MLVARPKGKFPLTKRCHKTRVYNVAMSATMGNLRALATFLRYTLFTDRYRPVVLMKGGFGQGRFWSWLDKFVIVYCHSLLHLNSQYINN